MKTYAALIGAAAGVALAVYFPPSFHVLSLYGSLAAAFGSGFCFAAYIVRTAEPDTSGDECEPGCVFCREYRRVFSK